MEILDILIPTYNRSKDLLDNLNHLANEITSSGLESQVKIIVSDNHSTDDTMKMLASFSDTHQYISLAFKSNETNIGLEPNVIEVLKMSTTSYVMFCGDDDQIAPGYLSYCVDAIQRESIGCIIPGLKSVDQHGNEKVGRIHSYESKKLKAGFDSVYYYSHLAHQMSGLVVNSDGLMKAYLNKVEYRNPYLFIYFIAIKLYKKDSLYAPKFKTAINVANEKDWGYNDIGLLDEVFKSYYFFKDYLKDVEVADLLIHFIRMHPYRINLSTKNIGHYIKIYHSITSATHHVKSFKWKLKVLLMKEYILNIIH